MKILHVLALFATIGLALARDFLQTLGIDLSYPLVTVLGIAVTTLLIFRGLMPIVALAILLLVISMPEALLQQYRLNHDLLLALVLTIVAYPWIRRLTNN